MAKMVSVHLNRGYSYRTSDEDRAGTVYGPGQVDVPQAMAENLKTAGKIDGWEEATGATTPSDVTATSELPADFPGRDALNKAGHTTYGHVAQLSRKDLIALPTIGEKLADQILANSEAATREATGATTPSTNPPRGGQAISQPTSASTSPENAGTGQTAPSGHPNAPTPGASGTATTGTGTANTA